MENGQRPPRQLRARQSISCQNMWPRCHSSSLSPCQVIQVLGRKNRKKSCPPSPPHAVCSLPVPSLSSGKVSPESIRTLRAPSESSDDQGQPAARAARRASSRIPAVLVRKPRASHRCKGRQSAHGARGAECHLLSLGHRLAKALSFLPGVHLLLSRRHVVQIGLQTI